MIFEQPQPLMAPRVSRHDFIQEMPAGLDSLLMGNGRVTASFKALPGGFTMEVAGLDEMNSADDPPDAEPVGRITLQLNGPGSDPLSPRAPAHLRLYDATILSVLPGGNEIESFVAARRNLIVTHIRSRYPTPLPATLEFVKHPFRSAPPQFSIDGPFRYLHQNGPDLFSGVMCGFVFGSRSQAKIGKDGIVTSFEVPPQGECLILAGVSATCAGPDPTQSARTEVEGGLPHGYLLLQREHAVWWEKFWSRSEPGIPDRGSESDYIRNLYRIACGVNPDPKVQDHHNPTS